jgi:hypothetical protein
MLDVDGQSVMDDLLGRYENVQRALQVLLLATDAQPYLDLVGAGPVYTPLKSLPDPLSKIWL